MYRLSACFGLVFVSDWRTRKAVQVSGTWVAAEWVLEVKGDGSQEPGLVMGGCPGHLWLHKGEWTWERLLREATTLLAWEVDGR